MKRLLAHQVGQGLCILSADSASHTRSSIHPYTRAPRCHETRNLVYIRNGSMVPCKAIVEDYKVAGPEPLRHKQPSNGRLSRLKAPDSGRDGAS